MSGSGTTALIISNEEMNYIMKIVKSLGESGLLVKKALAKRLKMNRKNKNENFLDRYFAL